MANRAAAARLASMDSFDCTANRGSDEGGAGSLFAPFLGAGSFAFGASFTFGASFAFGVSFDDDLSAGAVSFAGLAAVGAG
ncbi:MAG TPA: hypothetical protein DEB06_08390, partial [Phycisphaerales bacterium]|nr:hypothetical protein [Phycisphaerales bacterium]